MIITIIIIILCPLRIIRHWVRPREAGAAAELADSRKKKKYASIGSDYLFAPIAVETLGPMKLNTSACQLFANLGTKISPASGDEPMTGKELFCSREF